MSGRLEGKSALIHRSARGIGRAFAEVISARARRLRLPISTLNALKRPRESWGAQAYAVKMDVTDQASIDAAIALSMRGPEA